MGVLLLAIGYPVAIVVLTRWIPVVRQRRVRWFWAHQAGVACIVAGHAVRGRAQGVIINGAWLVIAMVWWVIAGRRQGAEGRQEAPS